VKAEELLDLGARPLVAQSGRTAVGEIGQLVESEADTIGDRSGVSLTWSGRKSIGAACLRSKPA